MTDFAVVVAWHNETQKDRFLSGWDMREIPDWLFLEQDRDKSGCAKTKNRGIERALKSKPEIICVIDDDCVSEVHGFRLNEWAWHHAWAMKPQKLELYESVTEPPSRGTPYMRENRFVTLPVAAVQGFWSHVGDYCAPAQLVRGAETPMKFEHKLMFWRFFPMSGMNVSFRAELWPHFKFDEEHDRFDDIFAGYRFQREAYSRGYCISTKGPTVRHERQSDPFKNLRIESEHAELNETLWQQYVR